MYTNNINQSYQVTILSFFCFLLYSKYNWRNQFNLRNYASITSECYTNVKSMLQSSDVFVATACAPFLFQEKKSDAIHVWTRIFARMRRLNMLVAYHIKIILILIFYYLWLIRQIIYKNSETKRNIDILTNIFFLKFGNVFNLNVSHYLYSSNLLFKSTVWYSVMRFIQFQTS